MNKNIYNILKNKIILYENQSFKELKKHYKFINKPVYVPNQDITPNIQKRIENYKLAHGLHKATLDEKVKNFLISQKSNPIIIAAVIGGSTILGVLIYKFLKKIFTSSKAKCLKTTNVIQCFKNERIKNYRIIINQLKQSKQKLNKLPEPYRTKAIKNIDKQINKLIKKIK